ncbi:MAG TPA: ATP-dependent zinc metalloprotease FtsH [Polyangiaceae bacterium]|jgi:cell division protease FtsH|nr:ATP-dependent zinc metalloprotease FtsH [Polyangiaceae bacterium]
MAKPTGSRPPPPEPRSSLPPPAPPERVGYRGWIILAVMLAGFWLYKHYSGEADTQPAIAYTSFYQQLADQKIESVTLRGQNVLGKFKAPTDVEGHKLTTFRSMVPEQEDRDLLPLLREKGVKVDVRSEEQPAAVQILISVLPLVLIIGVGMWLSRRAQTMMGPGGPLGNMLKGRSRRFEKEAEVSVKFDDVAGLKSAKQDLREIVDFLREPTRFRRLGGKVPRGVLLVGPPGTGKTLLARAVAGEAGVPFFSINGSEFIELFVGVGASRVRELFEEAKRVAPAIIFIDEIDAVGRSRGTGMGGGHDEREQTLNQLLSEMDGFTRNDLTIILAATNRPDVLDSALLRPGRFDRRVVIDRPELAARRAILEVHTRDKPIGADVDLQAQAANTPGFSGADLANLVNEAALSATRRGAEAIEDADFRAAYDKIVLGDPRETKLDPFEKKRVAVHESGHTVVAHFAPNAEPPERVTIIPRGMALGVTQSAPGGEQHLLTRPQALDRLHVMLGGYAAERVLLGEVSSGAENDLKRATELAFKMVAHWGMSDAIGPVYHEHRTEHPFLGQMLATEGGTSDATVHQIEEETRSILHTALQSAEATVQQRRSEMDALVSYLLEHESVDKTELSRLLGPGATRPKAEAAE